MSKLVDVSIQDIKELLKKKQGKIKTMEKMTNDSKEKLKKIHEKMDEQQQEIITIIAELAQSEVNLDDVIDDTLDMDEIEEKIENIIEELRKMRNTLADIIRKG